jgi:HSP20 family protein
MRSRKASPAVSLIRDVDELFDRHFGSAGAGSAVWEPVIDLYVEAGKLCLLVELPGVRAGDIEIRVGRRLALIRGIRRGRARSPRFYEAEIPYGPFERRVELPVPVDPARLRVGLADGVLSLEFDRATDEVRFIKVE